MGRGQKDFEVHYRKKERNLGCLENAVARNRKVRGASGEVSDINEKRVMGSWTEGDLCYKVAEKLAGLCSSVLWKVDLISDELAASYCI